MAGKRTEAAFGKTFDGTTAEIAPHLLRWHLGGRSRHHKSCSGQMQGVETVFGPLSTIVLQATNCVLSLLLPQVRARMFNTEVSALQFNVLVTTYEYIMRDRARLSKVQTSARPCNATFHPPRLCADDQISESSMILSIACWTTLWLTRTTRYTQQLE